MTARLNEGKLSLKKSEEKLGEEQMKNLALVKEFRRMEQECKVLRVEKVSLHECTNEVIKNVSAERQRGLELIN